MIFSCFCSNKRYILTNVITNLKFVRFDKYIRMINPISNEIVLEKQFPSNIVTDCRVKIYIIICTISTIYVLNETNFDILHTIELDEEILSCSSETSKQYFYIGCKSGKIIVYSIRDLINKIIVHDVWTYKCSKPVYSIVININDKKRDIFAGFLEQINYNLITKKFNYLWMNFYLIWFKIFDK